MRNYFAIAFIVVYLILTVGVAKTTHYCLGRFNNSTLFTFESKKCICSKFMSETSSCCDDETELITLDDYQKFQQTVSVTTPDYFEIQSFSFLIRDTHQLNNSENTSIGFFERPPTPDIPIFKLNCSLIFYS
jgi:hypothetical protein